MGELILRSIRVLEQHCDFIIIPSNTPHYCYDFFVRASKVPVLNLIDIAAEECSRRAYKKVAVLGTKPTMQDGLYSKALSGRGIEILPLSDGACEAIHDFIIHEIIPEKVSLSSTQYIRGLIEKLSCDAVILGCTELPEVFGNTLSIPSVDTTRLLARAAVEYASR
ncbi:MAG: hypothetical protein COV52_07700 [Gammaproteobacteria bacterium CG11_big_fil_rev_8_21_14_0_20_46_22]|nr:MAG: hypothetical protein COW05_03780 [Gammaproteobacteria bacterium CG12_big_fil_rev_8_21_14_0_65_46_12]PIR10641.1 MAG: hypothetical protein COV52_07700 [Gammaproteobacteria bacterium CG11_big_fil_rev_8_21_14_0_20_46_22]